MKEHKAVNVTRRCMRHDFRRACVYEHHRLRHLVANCEVRYDDGIQDIGCQVDARKDICTCKTRTPKNHEARYFSNAPEQIYAYHGVKSYSNIGIGNVKTIQRRRVRKIYLPETDDRGVGSSGVSAVIIRKPTYIADSYYVPKKMSSKCIGTLWQPAAKVISAKLSPIVKYLCATTGSEMPGKTNVEIGNNTEHKVFVTATTQAESADEKPKENIDPLPKDRKDEKKVSPKTKAYLRNKAREEEKFSSDSLVQHVHDLDCPPSSQEKLSKLSLDPMETKVEKEYREMFASNMKNKTKHPAPVKSTSLLRRRFEALRRGLKKDDSKKNESDTISSSPPSAISRKDVSIISDPPSLEARSYYDEKPVATTSPSKPYEASFRQSVTGKKDSFDSTDDDENEFDQDVSGMFKFWSKKFNLEESTRIPAKRSSDTFKEQDIDKIRSIDSKDAERKTGGKKFSFFKRRSKDKAKSEKPYKPKKGVTANRCEVKTGLVLQIGTSPNAFINKAPPPDKPEVNKDKLEDIQRKAWLKRFLSGNMDSKESVKIRWNNKTYTTSSSAVFELMDNVYKQTGIVIRSKSDIQTKRKFKPPEKKANFVTQHIEAWMIPRTITDIPVILPVKMKNTSDKGDTACIEVGISEQKRSIDKAKTFDKIMVTVRSSDLVEDNNKSSDYIRIDIPNDFFSESCEEEARGTSDEKVYKIVEYETLKSNTDVRKNSNLDTGDHANDIRVTVCVQGSEDVKSNVLETVIKRPPTHRDVVIQGSNVGFPKRCDVIGVGILTQRDVRELKPILKIQDDLTGDDSGSPYNTKKHCEFAESYLQEYCRQWMTGLDPSSWCLSDSGVRSPERNSDITLNQGDGTKSCPNIYDDYRPSLISPSHSSCSHSHNLLDIEYKNRLFYKVTSQNTKKKSKILNLKDSSDDAKKIGGQKKGDAAEVKKKQDKDKRVLPKDSVEVFKRRKIYACSNKSKWFCSSPHTGPCSVPSLVDQGAPECPKSCVNQTKSKGHSNKHVSVVDCKSPGAESTKSLEGILNFKGPLGCGVCKKAAGTGKALKVGSSCEIPPVADPLCKEVCKKKKKPPCKKIEEPCPPSPPSKCSSVISKISGCSDNCPVEVSAKPCPPPPCPPPPKCPAAIPSPPKCPAAIPSPPKCPAAIPPPPKCPAAIPSPPKCPAAPSPPKYHVASSSPPSRPSPPPSPCPPPPPPSGNPRVEEPYACECPTQSSSTYNCQVQQKRQPKPVKCSRPPCYGPPSPKCGACMTSPCSASQESCSPGLKLTASPSRDSCDVRYPKKCPMIPKPPKKKRNKYSECEKKCSYKKSSCEVGVDTCTPPEIPCPPAKPQPERDACFPPPPPCPPSPPSPRCPRVCSPTSVPPCPSPRQPCPAQAKLPKRGCQAQPTRSCPEAVSNTPPNAPCLPTSTPAIPCSEPEPCPALNNQKQPECPISCKDRKPKFNGLLLRKLPNKRKTCAEDCSSWANVDNCEHLNIRIKERTPSTEAIREIKLKGEDGVTLCERREYTKQEKRSIHRPAVLGEMYQPNFCQRVSTKSAQIVRSQVEKNSNITKVNSRSLDNLVEIQFTMKVTQGDKVTEINIGNDREVEEKNVQVQNSCSKEVYVVNNHACTTTNAPERVASNDTKNDINIHIVIKNYKPKDKKKTTGDTCRLNEDFANNISQKFHTVSTAYSDLHPDLDRNEASRTISVHRATWDLTGSNEKGKNQPSGDASDYTDKEIKMIETSQSMTSGTVSVTKFNTTTEEKSSWSEKVVDTKSEAEKEEEEDNDEVDDEKDTDKEIYKVDEIDMNPTTDETDLDIGIEVTHSNHASSDGTELSPREAKKKLLKMVIEKAGKIKHKNKTKVSKLTEMLKAIMTTSESSGNADTTLPENESVKHIVDSSLKTSVFRDTDSMNNFYHVSSMTSDIEDLVPDKDSDNSDVSFKGNSCLGCTCLCKTVAAKLNVLEQGGCCCKSPIKTYVSIETNCNIRTDEDMSYVLNYGPLEYIDEGTQRSKLFFSKANSANVSSDSISMKDINELSNVKNVRESKIKPEHDISHAQALSLNISAHPAQIEIDKEYDYRKYNRETVLNMSDDDKIIVANMEPKREVKEVTAHMKPLRTEMETDVCTEESDLKEQSSKVIAPADVLQSYETKKAVLEIYTKKTICNGRKRMVAKLPKFTIESESQIIKYEKICTRSFVMSFES